jgi:phosphate:Na+ symporter
MEAINDLENIGDTIETDLVYLGNERITKGVSISPKTREVLKQLHDVVSAAAYGAIAAATENDQRKAQDVIAMKRDINHLMDSAATHEAMRLVADEPNRLAAYTIEIDIIEKLKRIYYFAKRVAKAVMPKQARTEAA